MRQAGSKNTFRWAANVDYFYLCQTYARIPKHLICEQREPTDLVQTGLYQLETRLQRSREYRYMSYDEFCLLYREKLLAKKLWIFSDRQGQCA